MALARTSFIKNSKSIISKSSAYILLVGSEFKAKPALFKTFQDAAGNVEISILHDAEDGIHALVVGGYQLCVVHDEPDNPNFAVQFCADAKQAGIRVPIIVLMEKADKKAEARLIESGGSAAMLWDGSQESMMRNLVHMTVELRKSEENLRQSNDQLMMEMRTLQDQRERTEELGAQHIALMEDYAFAKDELEKLNQEKNKLFSIIAHDLRTPFTALLGFSKLLKDGAETTPTEKIKVFAAHIHKNSTSIFRLLENLLDWSRLQMNRAQVRPCQFSISDMTAKTFSVMQAVAEKKHIRLIEQGDGPMVYADQHMTDAVIRNLISNAIKFTPHHGVIAVLYDTDPDANLAQISIQDTGMGMDSETMDKLFKMSENVTTLGTDGEQGTGFGLLLCAELVERNLGTIHVESDLCEGSTFTFTLPLHEPCGENTK